VITSKILSRAEGRYRDLNAVHPSPQARRLAAKVDKDPALVHLILEESDSISRASTGVLIVRHRLGLVLANAGIDRSNARPLNAPPDSGPWVLLLPRDPDHSARTLRERLEQQTGLRLGVIITDSLGRPFRLGTVGTALGVAGPAALWDRRGAVDLDGRPLKHTTVALGDQIAAAADMVAGQANEARPVMLVRGLQWSPVPDASARDLQRPPHKDLYL
ncbi:MAG: coenzyme F420-0:L-glutamate ligase, partial [Myxococcota bacterium]